MPGIVVVLFIAVIIVSNTSFRNEVEVIPKEEQVYRAVHVPETFFFMGEKLPLWRFDVHENLDRELLVNSYFHSQTIRFLKLAPRYFTLIEPILREKGVPSDFKYLAVAESNLDPKAVSPAGAVGFWQFLKNTGIEYGLEINKEVDERYHIEKSTRAACDYLLKAYQEYGSWTLVAAAYNSGPGFVKQQMERQKCNNYFDLLLGEETERYVYRIIALKQVLENPELYGFSVDESEKYPVIETKLVDVKGPLASLTDFAQSEGISYKMLKYFNPWLRDYRLTNAGNKHYLVKIPVDIRNLKLSE